MSLRIVHNPKRSAGQITCWARKWIPCPKLPWRVCVCVRVLCGVQECCVCCVWCVCVCGCVRCGVHAYCMRLAYVCGGGKGRTQGWEARLYTGHLTVNGICWTSESISLEKNAIVSSSIYAAELSLSLEGPGFESSLGRFLTVGQCLAVCLPLSHTHLHVHSHTFLLASSHTQPWASVATSGSRCLPLRQ